MAHECTKAGWWEENWPKMTQEQRQVAMDKVNACVYCKRTMMKFLAESPVATQSAMTQ